MAQKIIVNGVPVTQEQFQAIQADPETIVYSQPGNSTIMTTTLDEIERHPYLREYLTSLRVRIPEKKAPAINP